MALPDYIDNNQHQLETVLKTLIKDEHQLILDIATGFFRMEAWVRLEDEMNALMSLRLLIGRDPTIHPAERDRVDLVCYFRQEVQQQLQSQDFRLEYKQQIERLIVYLEQDYIQVRLFGALGDKNQFLHAKAYIFDRYSIVGSSNFTPAGLSGNTELNVVNKIEAIARDLRHQWFEKFWNDPSVDVDYKAKLIDVLNASKFGSKPYTPYQVFLKALYELFKDESIIIGQGDRTSVELASFQQEGFKKAVRLIERHRGCMVADAVGLGKTYIGLRLIEYFLIKERKPRYIPRALVICPAQLKDLVWVKKLDEFGLKADILSHEEISRQTFEIRKFASYDIVVIDESHNFRNSGTNRHRTLLKLVSSGKHNKRVVLLTATPINNSIYDLYHQIILITRGDNLYYRDWGISNLETYFKALAKGNVEITDLLFEVMVRRSRQDVIRRQGAGEEIRINDKLIKFPERKLEKFTYNFEDTFLGLYANISAQIDHLNLAPYNIKGFKKRKQKADDIAIKRNIALVFLQKALYLKRFESSLISFQKSIRNQRDFQEKFYEILTKQNRLLDSKNFRKFILALEDEDENNTFDELLTKLEEITSTDYELNDIKLHIEADIKILNQILSTLSKIQESVDVEQDYDQKLAAFKELLVNNLKGQKVLVFSYFKDTAIYLYHELIKDSQWLAQMENPVIDCITGATLRKSREKKVKHFAPKANAQTDEELKELLTKPIDILICTDVLSEGQNLQDAGVLINYDLHWNPVRMIQRAGRIDRLGTEYENLYIYNCFPEEGLEILLGLVKRLQERIATIDSQVGLDSSILGETISGRSLEQLERLKRADTQAEKQAILEELEAESDLVSLDEMKLPLLEFIQRKTVEEVEEIPLGIHSTHKCNIPHPDFQEGGVFLAFKARDKHFWRLYPRIKGDISTDPKLMITDMRKIFTCLKCRDSDFPPPERLPLVPFDNDIFPVLKSATEQILTNFKKQDAGRKIKPRLSKIQHNIVEVLKSLDSSDNEPTDIEADNELFDIEAKERISQVFDTIPLKSFERDIKDIWKSYVQDKNLSSLISALDELFIENELYNQIKESTPDPLKVIRNEDIQLVCFEWFEPETRCKDV
jgi:superfamily II DNA or RNA helicase